MLRCMVPQWELLTVGWDASKCRVKPSLGQGKKLLIRKSSLYISWFICMCNIHLRLLPIELLTYINYQTYGTDSEHLFTCGL